MFRRLASVVLGLALLSGVALADTTAKISMAELRTKGIDTRNFSVFHVAGDGRTILASDEPDFTLKKKGILRRLFLIKLTPALKIESVKKYDLPIPKIEQANFTPDLQSVVISSKRGSDIHKLDLGDGKLSPIMTHSPGTAGFRIHGDVFSNYGGKLYTVGYFYDENDVAEKDVMAEVNPTLTGKAAFTQLVEIAPIQRQLNGIRTESLLSPQGMLFYTEVGSLPLESFQRSGADRQGRHAHRLLGRRSLRRLLHEANQRLRRDPDQCSDRPEDADLSGLGQHDESLSLQ